MQHVSEVIEATPLPAERPAPVVALGVCAAEEQMRENEA